MMACASLRVCLPPPTPPSSPPQPSNHVRAHTPTLVAFSVGVNERSDSHASSLNTSRDEVGGGGRNIDAPADGIRRTIYTHFAHVHVARARTRADTQRAERSRVDFKAVATQPSFFTFAAGGNLHFTPN